MSAHATRHSTRRACLLLLATFAASLFFPGFTSGQEVPELQINSEAYIVIDADTGEILAQKNAQDHRAMASLTKVFTALEAIKRAPLDMVITTAEDDVYDDNSTRVGFGAGEQFTLEELLYGMMLPSGNDAAHAIARALGMQPGDTGDEGYDRFIAWMNERLRLMGLENTNLLNPHGWGVPDHYSTAYDLAAFIRYALQEPAFVQLIGTASYTTSNGYSFSNTNRLLNSYPDLLGGKTGYDDDAGYCLIEVAQRNGRTVVSVTLDGVAPDDWYDDNRVLLDYAFGELEARGGVVEGDVAAYTSPDLSLLSVARASSALAGTEVQIAAGTDTSLSDTAGAQGDPVLIDAGEASSQAESAARDGVSAPGLSLPLAVALMIATAFIVLAGRGLNVADASIGRSLRSFFNVGRSPLLNRIRFRSASRKSPEEHPAD